jgi:hypothetical protein
METPEARQLGALLDEHHLPETNGRMAVCRRCGAVTDGPEGKHDPRERQISRTSQWLERQRSIRRHAGARDNINR